MPNLVSEIMTTHPESLAASATVVEAARIMRDKNIGDIIVLENDIVCGIVTDRDIVIRGLATGGGPETKLADVCSHEVTTLPIDSKIGDAVKLMEEKALRRLPVVDDGKPVGIVSLGDLAIVRDRDSALGQVSAAPPNN
ncbi:MAG: CBS domain-containing protein [Actinobacteria bacterium]|nr:MAG: CBS domain-containing protein [Actinomycetota bacterium]